MKTEQCVFVESSTEFDRLWERSVVGVHALVLPVPDRAVLYFDSAIVATRRFFQFVRALQDYIGANRYSFAFVALRPDPFAYFHDNFDKYPAIVFGSDHNESEYVSALAADPGGSPADALAFNAERYVVFPDGDDWFVYADEAKETAALSGSRGLVAFAREYLAGDVLQPSPAFKLVD
ncbi:hypothetical protein [Paraburkholderia gardini]|uniref:hypothetical protein n=1 Tax=Paraburkholderia gardini TaxID=2823469 RepID=UPI001D577A28|nr:hypothetical protein [Paraburkholderia gardini]CAG4893547.1 hypothetical protein R69919_01673 [Paraburkholderia gardini]